MSKKTKILFVSMVAPFPANFGGSIRCNRTLLYLSKNYSVTFVCPPEAKIFTDQNELAQLRIDEKIMEYQWPYFHSRLKKRIWDCSRLYRWCSGRYREFILRYISQREELGLWKSDVLRESFLNVIDEVKPDLIWFYQIEPVYLTGYDGEIPYVIDMDNLQVEKYARTIKTLPLLGRLIMWSDVWLLGRKEKSLAKPASVTLFAKKDNVEQKRYGRYSLYLPNGCDYSSIVSHKPKRTKHFVFIGLLTYKPNIDGVYWFCKNVWPTIISAFPDVCLDVIGKYDKSINDLGSTPGVTLHGFVENLDSIFMHSTALVVPLRIGAGTRIKILEAWSKGLPVVSTSIGCDGLEAISGEHLLVSDDADDFADSCIRLLEHSELGEYIAKQAYVFGKLHFDWNSIYNQMDNAVKIALDDKCM